MILGIDEVGRGPWAGPLVVGAVVLGECKIQGLTDSKKLSKKKREELDKLIRAQASGFGLGWVTAEEIDKIGLSESLKLATRRAVEQVKAPYHEIIIDGTINFLSGTNKGEYVTTMKKADLLISAVSAASIIAKVARDSYMAQQDINYPGYEFFSHVGYGTPKHVQAIEKLGVTPIHRLSFAPLKKYAINTGQVKSKISSNSTTKEVGDMAENIVATFLLSKGHQILERNWKTKFCEIDIVSGKGEKVYFTEVKYRKRENWGNGLDAITPKKLRQMKFAAEFYALKNNLSEIDMQLTAVSVQGVPPVIDKYLEIE